MGMAFERIKQGLNEAVGHAKDRRAGVKVWWPAAVVCCGRRRDCAGCLNQCNAGGTPCCIGGGKLVLR